MGTDEEPRQRYSSLKEVMLHEPIVHCILQGQGGSMEDVIVALANDRVAIIKRLEKVEMIAPRKIRTPEGIQIWRCPDEMVPEFV